MLYRLLLVSLLSATLLQPSAALAKGEDNAFCRGFIIKALAEFPVEGLSAIDLWLGWDAVVARTGSEGGMSGAEYQSGRDTVDSYLGAGDAAALVDIRNGRCDMGRNTGWFSWR